MLKNTINSKTLDEGLLTLLTNVLSSATDLKKPSLIEFSNPAIVRAITLVESSIVNSEDRANIMQVALGIYSSAYVSALSIAASSDEARILRTLGRLNPESHSATPSIKDLLDTESYAKGLPLNFDLEDDKKKKNSRSNDKIDNQEWLAKNTSIAVGHVVETKIGEDVVNISLGLAPKIIPSDQVVEVLTGGSDDKSWLGRWYGFRSGLVSAKEWLFCSDLLDNHRKSLGRDKSGVYTDVSRRRGDKKLLKILTGRVSVGQASSLFIITRDTANAVGRAFGRDFDDFITREKFFAETLGMVAIVVDERRDRIEIYSRSRRETQNFSMRDVRNKGGDDSMMQDMLKQFTAGSATPARF